MSLLLFREERRKGLKKGKEKKKVAEGYRQPDAFCSLCVRQMQLVKSVLFCPEEQGKEDPFPHLSQSHRKSRKTEGCPTFLLLSSSE